MTIAEPTSEHGATGAASAKTNWHTEPTSPRRPSKAWRTVVHAGLAVLGGVSLRPSGPMSRPSWVRIALLLTQTSELKEGYAVPTKTMSGVSRSEVVG